MIPLAPHLPPFRGQWTPPVDEVLSRNYFPTQQEGFFLECGAGDGLADATCWHFEERGWEGINFEPDLDLFVELQRNRRGVINLPLGLSDVGGTIPAEQLLLGSDHTVGVIVPATAHPLWATDLDQRGIRRRGCGITVVPYRAVVSRPVDLLVLDVEGHELKVIKGMADSAYLPKVICAEYPMVGLHPLQDALRGLGYRYDFISHNNAFFARPVVPMPPRWGETGPWEWRK